MQMATPRIVRRMTDEEAAEAYHTVGLDGYQPVLPVVISYAGLPDIMLPVPSEQLDSMHPDMDAIATLTNRLKAISIHAYALCDRDRITARVRDFAPACGVPEESATGTANAALSFYLKQNGCLSAEADCSFMQGEAMGRPSVVATQIRKDGTIYVGGTAAIVAKGEFVVNQ